MPDPPRDPKTELQEIAQAHGGGLPRYRIAAVDGPPHKRIFTAEVTVGEWQPAQGQGRSKRAAEVEAARGLLRRIGELAAEKVPA